MDTRQASQLLCQSFRLFCRNNFGRCNCIRQHFQFGIFEKPIPNEILILCAIDRYNVNPSKD